ncbi:MAG: hypothetical protein CEE40_08495 [Chloroflexi bacterium B3_Chlor]|nr:MAG: hypothetical protein CEE40_08495 [Chloroflexi bacterium B3_Chlor]
MMVYINYPDAHFTIHRHQDCSEIQKHRKPGQRVVAVRLANLTQVLSEFISGKYAFASNPALNDLWLDISLDTPEQEEGLVHVIQAILALRHRPLAHAPVNDHGC